jgi:hypothetical protein
MNLRLLAPCVAVAVGFSLAAARPACAQTAVEAKVAKLEKPLPDAPERVAMTKVQIVLDRAGFRPGKIDGLGGEFTQKAADRYAAASGLARGTLLDLTSVPEAYRTYTIRPEDQSWVGPQASKPPAQEKLKAMLYADLMEFVAERFHCDLGFLRELNPGIENPQPGDVLRVPDVEEFRIEDVAALEKQRRAEEKARKAAASPTPTPADAPSASPSAAPESLFVATPTPEPTPTPIPEPVRRLVLLRTERLIEVYEDDRMIGCFPCTPGSSRVPVPEGTWRVIANVLLPYFRWDKSVLESGVRSETAYNLPPGPNNPVGIVWMAINRPSVGMHGTPTPDQIGRNESAGCIRLANWDAFRMSQLVTKGTKIEVR